MPSIEYGIDGYGKKIYAQEAYSGRTYTCPYCLKEIHVRKCYDREDYFAHKSISNRTPQQMICKGYTGHGAYKRIENEVDQVIIINGGIPLYLCAFVNGKYQLNAYFPPLSQSSMDLLEDWDTKIVITENGVKEEYSVDNIRFYRVRTMAEWINVKCMNVKYSILEVKQKWEWGIRGLNCETDIFHSHIDGGCRVAMHSNIVLGKEYLIVKRNDNSILVEGISFYKKGEIRFIKQNEHEYSIYTMIVNNVTDESIAYIQNKGYQLIEQSDEIIPMWPPAVIEGKELIYRRHTNKAFLFHSKRSEQEIFNVEDNSLSRIGQNDNILEIDTNNKVLMLSDYQFNSFSKEIRFMLTQTRKNFDNEQVFNPGLMWKNDEGVLKSLEVESLDIFKSKKLFFEAETDIKVYVIKKNYVEISSKRIIESIKKNRKLVIDIEPFGKIWFELKTVIKKEQADQQIKVEDILEALYHCNSTSIPFSNEFIEVFEFARENSEELYKIMLQWRQKQRIPYVAIKYLHSIKEALSDE